MDFPFKEKIKDGYHIRTFTKDVEDSELVWHRDKEDRIVESVGKTNWMIQMDNEVPKVIEGEFLIPKNTYHRVIKGDGNLIVKVKKLL